MPSCYKGMVPSRNVENKMMLTSSVFKRLPICINNNYFSYCIILNGFCQVFKIVLTKTSNIYINIYLGHINFKRSSDFIILLIYWRFMFLDIRKCWNSVSGVNFNDILYICSMCRCPLRDLYQNVLLINFYRSLYSIVL
jgi:hypothetical protein